MIENIVAVTNMGYAGLVIWKGPNVEEETPEAREARVEKALEDAKEVPLVPVIYNSRREIMEYDKYGRPINIRKIMEHENSGRHFNTKR